jgi:hypothetical protein
VPSDETMAAGCPHQTEQQRLFKRRLIARAGGDFSEQSLHEQAQRRVVDHRAQQDILGL